MKRLFTFFALLLMAGSGAYSQMVTNDPIHTAITTLIKMFQDPSFKTLVSNIEKLKKVSSSVRQFHRGTEIVHSITSITNKLTTYSAAIAKDGHIYPVEYQLMSQDIQLFTAEAQKLIKDMKSATTAQGGVLQMTDAERAQWLDDTYMKVAAFDVKVSRYFKRIESASLQRSASKADLTATRNLYQFVATIPQGYFGGGQQVYVEKDAYDRTYQDSLTIPLDYLYKTQAFLDFQKKMRACEFRNQLFYKRQEYEAAKMQTHALAQLLARGYRVVAKNGFLQSQATAQQNLNNILQLAGADSASYTSTSTNGSTLSFDMQQVFENEIMAIYDPSGKRITSEIMQMEVEFLAKELYLAYGIDQQLEQEYKIDECKQLSQDFDAIMKAAEEEYLKNNPVY
jgi:hypothetical protein